MWGWFTELSSHLPLFLSAFCSHVFFLFLLQFSVLVRLEKSFTRQIAIFIRKILFQRSKTEWKLIRSKPTELKLKFICSCELFKYLYFNSWRWYPFTNQISELSSLIFTWLCKPSWKYCCATKYPALDHTKSWYTESFAILMSRFRDQF